IISSALCLRTVSLYLTQFLFLILFQLSFLFFFFFFFTDTATTEIYTLSLHDALPIFGVQSADQRGRRSGEQHRRRLPLRDQSRPHPSHRASARREHRATSVGDGGTSRVLAPSPRLDPVPDTSVGRPSGLLGESHVVRTFQRAGHDRSDTARDPLRGRT